MALNNEEERPPWQETSIQIKKAEHWNFWKHGGATVIKSVRLHEDYDFVGTFSKKRVILFPNKERGGKPVWRENLLCPHQCLLWVPALAFEEQPKACRESREMHALFPTQLHHPCQISLFFSIFLQSVFGCHASSISASFSREWSREADTKRAVWYKIFYPGDSNSKFL